MRTYDLSPLYRSGVGFDSLFSLLDSAMKLDESVPAYPPYNIEKQSEDAYRISMAVAGFAEADLGITTHNNVLVVTGKKSEAESEEEKNFLYRGIAARAFERRFQLAEHVKVTGASLKDGLLHIDLSREVPEAMKPRMIPIGSTEQKTLEGKKAH
jgi:molecular chaperone IbpA